MSGVNANMTMDEFNAAKFNGDRVQIDVEYNKTFINFGDAAINISSQVYSWFKLFVNARNQLTSIVDDFVFLSWSGKKCNQVQ